MQRATTVETPIVVGRRAANGPGWRPLTLSEAHALWQEKGGASNSARAAWLVPSSPPAARAEPALTRRKSLVRCCHAVVALLGCFVNFDRIL
jgi:hypothetical protein